MADNSHHSYTGPTFVNNQFLWRLCQQEGQIGFLEDNTKRIITLLMFDISKSFKINNGNRTEWNSIRSVIHTSDNKIERP